MTSQLTYADGLETAAQIAIKWRDENKVAAAKARKSDGVLAEQLEGAAIECNAIAGAIRELIPCGAKP